MGNPLDNPTLSLSMMIRQAELKSSHGCDRPEGREMLHQETTLTHTPPVEHTYTHITPTCLVQRVNLLPSPW